MQKVNMNHIVGTHHILFVCLDSLRYDVAWEEQEKGNTPILNQYGRWRKCQTPGNFTYPAHQAMFAGFFPLEEGIRNMKDRETLFFSEDIGLGRKAPEGAFSFSGPNWIQGLEQVGYDTYCIGGVSFFDKRTDMGKVMPSYFRHSHWAPAFGCRVKESPENQVEFAVHKIGQIPRDTMIMMYLNISAFHYPNYFYLPGSKKDSKEACGRALAYVDEQLGRLFHAFGSRGDTFVICCSDHGSCFGEDGVWYHGVNHPLVNTVPYKHFFL